MKGSINFICFAVLAVIMTLLKISGVIVLGVPAVLMTFVTYVVANILCELHENKKNLHINKN